MKAPASNASTGIPVVRVRGGILHDLATEAEFALIDAGAPFYTRGAQIVRPIVDEVDAAKGCKTKTARLTAVTADVMVDHLSRSAVWERYDRRSRRFVPIDPPRSVATTVLSRDGEWMLPPLAGVITTPTMRPDGSILSEPGWDPDTRLLLLDPPIMPLLVANPTREDALAALALIEDLLVDFPFVDDGSSSVALSALITPIVRGAMPVAPLHAMRAPSPGSGKSYLVDLASAIATGQRCPVIAAGRSGEETEKRLGAAMLAGYPLISIDNLNGCLGGDALCQLIERPRVSIRPLGRSELVTIESRATVYATGNNIQPTGDVIRRVITSSLDPNLERPELRAFKRDPFALVSVEFYISTYRRGETQRHHYTRTLNIDVEYSTELSLKNIVHNEAMAMKFFSIYCENALRVEPDFYFTGKDWKFNSSGTSISQSFGFRNADLIFIFAPRDIGGHAFGRKVVELPFNDVYRFLTDRIIDLLVGQQEPADVAT